VQSCPTTSRRIALIFSMAGLTYPTFRHGSRQRSPRSCFHEIPKSLLARASDASAPCAAGPRRLVNESLHQVLICEQGRSRIGLPSENEGTPRRSSLLARPMAHMASSRSVFHHLHTPAGWRRKRVHAILPVLSPACLSAVRALPLVVIQRELHAHQLLACQLKHSMSDFPEALDRPWHNLLEFLS